MTAFPRFVPVDLSCPNRGTKPAEQSFGLLSEQKSATKSGGCPVDLDARLRMFPDLWPQFLRAHFRSATEVAVFFDITERAARKWWEGDATPRGAQIIRLEAVRPGSIQYFLRAA